MSPAEIQTMENVMLFFVITRLTKRYLVDKIVLKTHLIIIPRCVIESSIPNSSRNLRAKFFL